LVADAWEAGGSEPGELYRGARLGGALEALDRRQGSLTDREPDRLDAGRAARDADADHQRRANRRLRRLLALVGTAVVVALVAGTVAFAQQRSARNSNYRVETSRLLARPAHSTPATLDIPRRQMSSGGGKFRLRAVGPGDGLVVGGVVGEAAVEDADEAVAEGAEGLVVSVC
jgi:hypothetical protein